MKTQRKRDTFNILTSSEKAVEAENRARLGRRKEDIKSWWNRGFIGRISNFLISVIKK